MLLRLGSTRYGTELYPAARILGPSEPGRNPDVPREIVVRTLPRDPPTLPCGGRWAVLLEKSPRRKSSRPRDPTILKIDMV